MKERLLITKNQFVDRTFYLASSNRFLVPSKNSPTMTYELWMQLKQWLDENNIDWRAGGNSSITFLRDEDVTLFLLRWA